MADRVEDAGDGLLVRIESSLQALLELGEALGKFLVAGEQVAQPDKGPHDLDVDGDGAFAPRTEESIATPCSVKA